MKITYAEKFNVPKDSGYTFVYEFENNTLTIRPWDESKKVTKVSFDYTDKPEGLRRIVLTSISANDYSFKLLKKNHKFEIWHKNLTGIRMKTNDTKYYMDTIIVSDIKGRNRVKIDEIGFSGRTQNYNIFQY